MKTFKRILKEMTRSKEDKIVIFAVLTLFPLMVFVDKLTGSNLLTGSIFFVLLGIVSYAKHEELLKEARSKEIAKEVI